MQMESWDCHGHTHDTRCLHNKNYYMNITTAGMAYFRSRGENPQESTDQQACDSADLPQCSVHTATDFLTILVPF